MRKNAVRNSRFLNYVIGSTTSMFVGIVVYFLCKNFEAPEFLTAVITSLSGYMGSTVLDLLSNVLKKRVEKEVGELGK